MSLLDIRCGNGMVNGLSLSHLVFSFSGGVDFIFLLRASAIEQAHGSQLGVGTDSCVSSRLSSWTCSWP